MIWLSAGSVAAAAVLAPLSGGPAWAARAVPKRVAAVPSVDDSAQSSPQSGGSVALGPDDGAVGVLVAAPKVPVGSGPARNA
ncbi:MAG: hypothetical protein QOD41_5101, partial [Cryptosporangiaceae bacterium]|nr:hypothetical protein [Cryptosporangiaceae bacterium]